MDNTSAVATRDVIVRLVAHYLRNGYFRWQDSERLAAEGRSYKKGDELRFAAATRAELAEIRRLLRAAGFKYGRPYRKAKEYRQPVYGREQVARFIAMVHDYGSRMRRS
jgi:hypothetical protein